MRTKTSEGFTTTGLRSLALLVTAITASSCGGGSGPAGTDGGAMDSAPGDAPVDGDGPVALGAARLAVPAYFAPGPDWQRMIAAAPTVGLIVVNPNSGPGTATDPGYTSVIAQAQAAGIIVLGYVSTNYGQRAEADVTADINAYYDLYRPSGIYLAEGPMETDCTTLEAQYHRFSDAAHARDSRAYLSVGTRFCPTFIYFTDLMIEFARNWTEYQTYQSPAWMPANSPTRFCHFVDSVPAAAMTQALSLAIGNGAGWVYVTDGVDPNPWGQLPSYFDQELAALRK